MPTDWDDKVRAEPNQALAIIDDVVAGEFAAAELATIHGIPQVWIGTTLGHVTRAVGSGPGPVARRRQLVCLPGV